MVDKVDVALHYVEEILEDEFGITLNYELHDSMVPEANFFEWRDLWGYAYGVAHAYATEPVNDH